VWWLSATASSGSNAGSHGKRRQQQPWLVSLAERDCHEQEGCAVVMDSDGKQRQQGGSEADSYGKQRQQGGQTRRKATAVRGTAVDRWRRAIRRRRVWWPAPTAPVAVG
jgi:hypothetical protein